MTPTETVRADDELEVLVRDSEGRLKDLRVVRTRNGQRQELEMTPTARWLLESGHIRAARLAGRWRNL